MQYCGHAFAKVASRIFDHEEILCKIGGLAEGETPAFFEEFSLR
jgi:hypothetical protein